VAPTGAPGRLDEPAAGASVSGFATPGVPACRPDELAVVGAGSPASAAGATEGSDDPTDSGAAMGAEAGAGMGRDAVAGTDAVAGRDAVAANDAGAANEPGAVRDAVAAAVATGTGGVPAVAAAFAAAGFAAVLDAPGEAGSPTLWACAWALATAVCAVAGAGSACTVRAAPAGMPVASPTRAGRLALEDVP